MRQFQNSVLDFKQSISGDFVSAALETAWASEAIFFIRVEEISKEEGFTLRIKAQISVNGIDWIDEGKSFPEITQGGQYALRLTHFGGWLRLKGSASAQATLTTNLVLKE